MASKEAEALVKKYTGGWREDRQEAAMIRDVATANGTWGVKGGSATSATTTPVSSVTVPATSTPSSQKITVAQQKESAAEKKEEPKEAPSKKDAAKTTMEQAAKAYDDYIKSDEYKQRMQEAENKARLDAAVQATVNPNFDMMTPQMIRDEKAEQLRAARDQAEEDYNIAAQQEAEKAAMLAMDLDAAKQEIDALQKEIDNFYLTHDYTGDAEYQQKKEELSSKIQLYNQAKQLQKKKGYKALTSNEDFAANSGYVSTEAQNFRDRMFSEYGMGYNDLTYEYINDPERVQEYSDEFTRRMLESNYELMQNDEIAIYNYIHATEGKKAAEGYLDTIQEDLNRRRAEQIYSALEGNTAKEIAFAANAGVNSAMNNTKALLSRADYIPLTATQQASQLVRQDLQDRADYKKAETGVGSFAPVAYDLINTTANMLPSIAMSTAANVVLPGSGAFVGTASMGTSAAGGAYQQALNAGYSKEQARTYAALTGASEAGLDYVLGGISKLGGEIPQQIIKNMVRGVDNAVARAAINLGGSMLSEGFEEGLQEVITPWIENLTLYTDKDVNWDEVAYSTLLGALSGGLMEGPGVIANTYKEKGSSVPAPEPAQAPQTQPVQAPQGSENGGNDVLMRTMEQLFGIQNNDTQASGGTLNGEELLSAMGLDKIINSGGTVTNSMAEQILRDPEALDIILQETATQLVGSRAAQRAQIKNAVYQLAGVQPESDATPVQQPAAQQAPTQQPPVQQAPQQQTQAPTNTKQQKNAVYAELQHAVAAQKDLQKKIDKAEAKVASGKGSAAYLAQLKAQMEQQTKRVDQLRSQNDYFGGDYDTTVEKAAQTQQAVFDQARQEAIDAENDFNEGRISKAQYDAAQQKYNTAGQELFRLKNMTQEQYAEELASVGLVADRQPDSVTPTKAVPAQQQEAPQVAQQPEAVQPQAQTPQQQTPVQTPTMAQEGSAQQMDTQTAPDTASPMPQGQPTTGTQPDYRDSKTYMNTGINSTNPNIRAGYRQELRENPDAAKYAVKHNADTLAEARSRVSTPENANAALDDLLTKEIWTPEDVATSTLLLDQIMASGDRDAIAKLNDLRRRRKDTGVQAGQVAQSFSINNSTMRNADSPATAVDTFRSNLDSMSESETTYNPKSGVDFETWKQNIQEDVDRIGIAIATVEDGDADSMRDIIKQIARARKTTAWFGTSNNVTATANRILGKLGFEDLKKIANTQVAAMADDYRKRGAGEVAGTIRKQNMLSSLKTFARNIGGNIAGGFGDAVSESGAGQLADLMLSKFTGKRTVGNDLTRGKEYARAAKEAAQFASLCVELNIPIETDADSSFSVASGNESNQKYVGRTFRATGNPAMRALYAYQKYMSYALEVTDKIFEGGSNAAVQESLARLQNANLTEQEAETLGQFAANKRTFKNATWEEGGKTRGAEMARLASSVRDIGRGTKAEPIVNAAMDVAMPFTNVPMNVAQTGIDYTAGVAKSIGEMISIIKDVKAGKTIPVERQRQAASDFGRGVTGTAMVGMFAAAAAMGALKASEDDDWNKEALALAEGRSGAQINWSALMRGLNGESAKWQKDDIITGMDFLEPFNTQMYLGAELANTEDMNLLKYAGATVKSVWNSLMDSPVMTGLSDIVDTITELSEAETAGDLANVAAGYAGDVASSFIPQYVRQTAQEMDGYYRDTRGETPIESAANSVKAALPGLSKTLPVKYSGLGEVQERGSAFETFVDPTATKRYNPNEVTTYLDKLNEATGDDSIYPERQAPMKVNVDGEKINLDGKQRETYQKTYGDKVNEIYSDLMENETFNNLPPDLQAKALKDAESYASEVAKSAVVEGYEAEYMTPGDEATTILNKTVTGAISSALDDLTDDLRRGNDTTQAMEAMEQAYKNYSAMTQDEKRQFMEGASGRVKYYVHARNLGVNTETFSDLYKKYRNIDGMNKEISEKAQLWSYMLEKAVDDGTITERQKDNLKQNMQYRYSFAAETEKFDEMIEAGVGTDSANRAVYAVKNAAGTGENGAVRDIDKRGAIADLNGVSDAEKDAIMKAYMTDYDPNAKSPQKTELKYDYARQELGLTPQEYIDVYTVQLDGGKKAQKLREWEAMGYTPEQAQMFYRLFSATGRTKIDVEEWFRSILQ